MYKLIDSVRYEFVDLTTGVHDAEARAQGWLATAASRNRGGCLGGDSRSGRSSHFRLNSTVV